MKMARHAHQLTGCENLVMAGGVALNCVANGRLVREGPFENVWIQPAAGDAGGALGAALFVHHQLLGAEPRTGGRGDAQQASLLGPAYTDEEIGRFLEDVGVGATRYDDPDRLSGRVAGELAAGKVVGWFQGRMEFGPRALGARSILGDPRDPEMQSTLNLKIKFRESFRPFAPAVMREHAGRYFELDRESPYMLLVAPVREEHREEVREEQQELFGIDKLMVKRSVIPAITHVDYSARIQSVHPDDNKPYYDMIRAFKELTGCGVIINTSFNVRGEPIVCKPEHAYTCFMRTEMDYLAIGAFLLAKSEQPEWKEQDDWRSEFQLD